MVQITSATEPSVQISALLFYALGEMDKGLEGVRKCMHSDPDSRVCGALLKRERRVEKVVRKVKESVEKRNFNAAVRELVPGSDKPGLLQTVLDDVKEWRELGYIHANAPDGLYLNLLETTCDAYLEVPTTPTQLPMQAY